MKKPDFPEFTKRNTGKCDACGKTDLLRRDPSDKSRRICWFGCRSEA